MKDFRADKQQQKDIRNYINRYNTRVRQIQKMENFKDVAPPELDYKTEKMNIHSGKELGSWKRRITAFLNQKSIQVVDFAGAKTLDFFKETIKRDLKKVNKIREAERKKRGIDGNTAQMSKVINSNLHEKTIPKFKKNESIYKFAQNLKNQTAESFINTQDEAYRRNLRIGIIDQLGDYADDIIKIYDTLSTRQIIDFYDEGSEITFGFLYGPQSREVKRKSMINLLKKKKYITQEQYDNILGNAND